jgi:hypothetical protein
MNTKYEAPTISEIGLVHELTGEDKNFGGDDGFTLQGQQIGNSSQI